MRWTGRRSRAISTVRRRRTAAILTPEECAAIAAHYDAGPCFASRVVMARHGFGSGEYQYFAYPLPATDRSAAHGALSALAPIANRWTRRSGIDARFPAGHAAFLARCHAAGQTRPTPLLLRYGAGDYNCLHQDLYGEHVFPLQVAFLLSEPGADFTGGEFVLTEQRPRMQSRAEVVPLRQGDAVIFAVHSPAGPGRARGLPRQHAPWREPHPSRASAHARASFSMTRLEGETAAEPPSPPACNKSLWKTKTPPILSVQAPRRW